MCAGRFFFKWQDDGPAKEVSSDTYIENLLLWTITALSSDAVLTQDGVAGPDFHTVCCRVCKRMLRAFAHYYIHHDKLMKESRCEDRLIKEIKRIVLFM